MPSLHGGNESDSMKYEVFNAKRSPIDRPRAAKSIVRRRRIADLFRSQITLTLTTSGGTMTLAKLHLGPNHGKRKLTTLELLLIAAFLLFLAYMSVEPLTVPAGSATQAKPLIAAVPPVQAPAAAPAEAQASVPAAATSAEAAQPVADQTVAVVAVAAPAAATPAAVEQKAAAPAASDVIKPVFVVTPNSTILERIAPVATVTVEDLAAPAMTAEAAVPAPAAPAPVAPQAAAPVEAAPAPSPAVLQAAPVAEAPKQAVALRFEISDATGVDGFAKNLAQALEQSGIAIANVASVPAGKQRRTVILFRDGFEEEAKRLAKLFVTAPALVNNTASRNGADSADVKLVLGTAAAREKNLLASDSSMPKLSLGRLARSN